MNKKDKEYRIRLASYIQAETGVTLSKNALAFISDPCKIEGLNKTALEALAHEVAPVLRHFSRMLDGPAEAQTIAFFSIVLSLRCSRFPDLERLLNPWD